MTDRLLGDEFYAELDAIDALLDEAEAALPIEADK
jgi:hypothetical protein